MYFYAMTDKAITEELGKRIRSLRLKQNKTHEELANATMLSISTIKRLEKGNGKLLFLIAVLRELDALDHLNNFIPEITISPIKLAKLHGKKRQRASGKKVHNKNDEEDYKW